MFRAARASRSWTVLAPLLAAMLGRPCSARAAACCISATSFGHGRLLIWEDYALGLQLGHARALGQWDAAGALQGNPAGFADGITRVEPWAILRLAQRFQLQAWAPFLVNDRQSAGTSQVAGGLGDLGAALRIELVGLGEYQGLPSFAVTAGGIAPAGRRVEETDPPLFAGTTGRGAWAGSLALESEYAFLPWFVRLDAGGIGYLSFRRSDTGQRQRYGPLLQVSLSAGREVIADVLVVALAVSGQWEAPLRLDGATVPGSREYLYSAAASLSWRCTPHWTLTGGVTNSVWPAHAGMNQDARLGFTLGARYGHF